MTPSDAPPRRRLRSRRRRDRGEVARRRSSLKQDALNVPNLLTMARVAVIPVVLWLLDRGTPKDCVLAALVYSAACSHPAPVYIRVVWWRL